MGLSNSSQILKLSKLDKTSLEIVW